MVKNRKEEFARFEDAEPERIKLSSDAMNAKFQPSTDMEHQIDVVAVSALFDGRSSSRAR